MLIIYQYRTLLKELLREHLTHNKRYIYYYDL